MKYKIEQGNEEINSTGEISLVGGILNNLKVFDNTELERQGGKLTHSGYCRANDRVNLRGTSQFR